MRSEGQSGREAGEILAPPTAADRAPLRGRPGAVINARYEACRATSVVTNLDLDALAARVDGAIVGHLAETNTASWCEWESYRRRRPAGG